MRLRYAKNGLASGPKNHSTFSKSQIRKNDQKRRKIRHFFMGKKCKIEPTHFFGPKMDQKMLDFFKIIFSPKNVNAPEICKKWTRFWTQKPLDFFKITNTKK